jgi:hypothetical protein
LVTPSHIVPEWYFLPLYAVLRSVVSKLLGIFLLTCVFLALFLLPFYLRLIIRSSTFRPINAFFVWGFFFVCLCLGWIGGLPVIEPFVSMGLFFTILFFFFLLVLFPFFAFWDRLIYDSYVFSYGKLFYKDFFDFVCLRYAKRRKSRIRFLKALPRIFFMLILRKIRGYLRKRICRFLVFKRYVYRAKLYCLDEKSKRSWFSYFVFLHRLHYKWNLIAFFFPFTIPYFYGFWNYISKLRFNTSYLVLINGFFRYTWDCLVFRQPYPGFLRNELLRAVVHVIVFPMLPFIFFIRFLIDYIRRKLC